ncbi:ABC transporter ATP-binding protein/permease [Granulibacter bethesdensis]|uniref:ABC transporter ATP-binding protein n=1 Tax=Granulibacter bethesdensis (strain ATCC BAA-1260 / CGDNIH1) TaxID=391165 RepID=Q0BTS0_GRABC|nr:ABC transporter ATP-binding protein/permease [Granulibacter bethesdensis]ABI61782.1 ABC transporter ATP-binding protein [Granulibacter bethesdensis CGDNIH1]APH51592.1 ABC transporter ATP-binding protein [Granulibacter bethesdensis]APH64285.1 ABC transporter ATP-binding protein [Granulibacter bethesdensis]
MHDFGKILRGAWRLTIPYFLSEEKWVALGLLATVLSLNLAQNGLDLVMNYWHGAFFNALQEKDASAFVQLFLFWYKGQAGFITLAIPSIIFGVASIYLQQSLQIRWRRWLTKRMIDEWIDDRIYYRLGLLHQENDTATDNPDQRISDDIRDFTSDTLSIGFSFISNAVTLVMFLGVLWSLSGAMTIFGFHIPGYMLWGALIYSIIGTLLTHLIGRKLIYLRFVQQRYEANLRFALVRVRENSEGIALYHGEAEERATAKSRFGDIVINWYAMLRRYLGLNSFSSGYDLIASVFPYVMAAPHYFSGQITLGGLQRTSQAFSRVQGSLSWFVSSYTTLASWGAVVSRLSTFQDALNQARAAERNRAATLSGGSDTTASSPVSAHPNDVVVKGLNLSLPTGEVLLHQDELVLSAGQNIRIKGRSGSGKSTLFRALAGIWPFGSVQSIHIPGRFLFLPQRPYLPLGSLRRAVTYPLNPSSVSDEQIADAMHAMRLDHLIPRLDQTDQWSHRLSGGEQQRIALARALLVRPDWLFMDEATANLDSESEQEAYQALRQKLPETTIVSIAHGEATSAYHDRTVILHRPEPDQAGILRPA